MAVIVLTNGKFQVNGTDLSAYTKSMTLNYSAEMQDKTAFGATSRARTGGLKSWSLDVTFNQDFASGAVDGTLWSLVGTTSCVEARPLNACSTTSNPIFSGIAVLDKYPPLSGNVGTIQEVKASWQSAGDLARNTSAT